MTSTVTFSSCTCSTGRPRILCADCRLFWGVQPRTPPLVWGLLTIIGDRSVHEMSELHCSFYIVIN